MNDQVYAIAKRELSSYFATPLAAVFMVIFLILSGIFTFYAGGFFERGQADLQSFFAFHPWLYLLLIPAIAMRLWAEERKTGTVELTLTLPVSTFSVVFGKFLASWAFTSIALMLTFPLWIVVNVLGSPDNGVILASYIASLMMAGAFLAIGSCISAMTKSQVIAFVASTTVCLGFIISGLEAVTRIASAFAPEVVVRTIAAFSFLTHFASITKGVIDLRNLIFFASLTAFWLFANVIIVDYKKAT